MKALALLLAAIGPAVGQSAPRFDLPRSPVLTDEVVPIANVGIGARPTGDDYAARNGVRLVPLEYFKRALDWLAAQPFVDSTRIAVMGASRGAEAALLVASTYPQVHAVIATSPTNVVVGGCCSDRFADAWTLNGSAVRRAEIAVENIHGPVLLLSGTDDGLWPSARSAESIVRRLKEHQFAYPVTNRAFADAGHSLVRPHSSTMDINSRRHPLTGRIVRASGTPEDLTRASSRRRDATEESHPECRTAFPFGPRTNDREHFLACGCSSPVPSPVCSRNASPPQSATASRLSGTESPEPESLGIEARTVAGTLVRDRQRQASLPFPQDPGGSGR